MKNTVTLPFSPDEFRRQQLSDSEFELWVRGVWIEDKVTERRDGAYIFPAINYAHDGWRAGYKAGYQAGLKRKK